MILVIKSLRQVHCYHGNEFTSIQTLFPILNQSQQGRLTAVNFPVRREEIGYRFPLCLQEKLQLANMFQ